jgi:hypothetical protein
MSFVSQVGQVIQGDSATTAATWVPTLNAGVDQKKFMVTADPAEFMMNTPLILNDNYYHRSDDRTFSTYITDSGSQKTVQIQGVTANMAYLPSFYLEFNLVLTMNNTGADADQYAKQNIWNCINDLSGQRLQRAVNNKDIQLWNVNNQTMPLTFQVPDNVTQSFVSDDFIPYMNDAVFEAPSFWQMEIIQNITFEIGNNVQTLGRSAGQGISLIKAMNSMIVQDEKFRQMFGFFNSESGLSSHNNTDYVKHDPVFKNFYQQLIQVQNGVNDGQFWNNQNNESIKFTIPIRIPFKMLNSAFNQPLETWWPAGVPFKITIDFYPTPKRIFTSPYIMKQSDDNLKRCVPLWSWDGTVGDLINTTVYMQTHLLRQPTQESLNLQWTSSPLLYQYITTEPVRLKCDGVNTLYNVNIAVNQQCPTHIIFFAEWSAEPIGVYPETPQAGGADLVIAENDTFFFKGRLKPSSVPIAQYTDIDKQLCAFQRHGNRKNSPMPMFLNSMKLVLTGTKKYELKWNGNGFINLTTGQEVQKDLITYSSYNRHDTSNEKSIRNKMYGIGNYYHLTLSPGLMLDVGYQSTDWGAQVINLELEVYNKGVSQNRTTPAIPVAADTVPTLKNLTPLPNTYQITVAKVLPEQYNLDINRNVSIVKYPAVTTTSGYILPTASSINAN